MSGYVIAEWRNDNNSCNNSTQFDDASYDGAENDYTCNNRSNNDNASNDNDNAGHYCWYDVFAFYRAGRLSGLTLSKIV